MPGASQGFFLLPDNCWKDSRARHRNLGESWSVVMRLIMQVIDRLARTTALPVLLQKIKSGDVMVEGSFGSGDCEIIVL